MAAWLVTNWVATTVEWLVPATADWLVCWWGARPVGPTAAMLGPKKVDYWDYHSAGLKVYW
jgi:hypothetical protein